ncbi:MAG: hypothetical protein AAGF93_05435 [Cyanobacteria bacterium P01_H01_bin.105]
MYALIGIDTEGNQSFYTGEGFHQSVDAAMVYVGMSLESLRVVKGKLQQAHTDKDIQIAEISRIADRVEDDVQGSFPLDAYPGASLFALEQLYSDFPGPFYSGSETAITELIGTQYTANVTHGPIDVSSGVLDTNVEFSFLQSQGSVLVTANRMVIAVLSVKGSNPDENDRGLIAIGNHVIFKVNDQNQMIVNAPKTDGSQGWVSGGAIPADDEFFLAAFKVETNNLKVWINGTLSIDQFVDSIASANDIVRVFVRGVRFKMLATWNASDIPSEPETLVTSLMNHYGIS